jgi:hypothetical protein
VGKSAEEGSLEGEWGALREDTKNYRKETGFGVVGWI